MEEGKNRGYRNGIPAVADGHSDRVVRLRSANFVSTKRKKEQGKSKVRYRSQAYWKIVEHTSDVTVVRS